MSISDERRNELVRLIQTPGRHGTKFTSERPTDWEPMRVRDPSGGLFGYFTDEGAWELIAKKLEAGHCVEQITLDKPPGKTAYVLVIPLVDDEPLLYVKLEIVRGSVLGRSFHYSRSTNH